MKTIVFDFDGTLLNSCERHINVLNDCLLELGYNLLIGSDYLEFKCDGNSTIEYLKNRGISENESRKISNYWIEKIENKNFLKADHLYSDAISALNICKSKEYNINLLSARKNEQTLVEQVNALGIIRYFKEVVCVTPVNAVDEKTLALQKMNADILIGDTEVDFEAANRAGVFCYILNRGFRSEKYWISRGVKSFGSLLDLEY